MSFLQPVLSFLRPMGPPRPATLRHFLRFSQSAFHRDATPAFSDTLDPNLVASRTAPSSYPPNTLKSIPRPLKSHASHRTSQPTKIRDYPDRVNKNDILNRPTGVSPSAPALAQSDMAPNLPYFVTRTPSNELPIYHLRKRGGNLRLTRVKKIDGNIDYLRSALQTELALPENEVLINRLTNHVVIKGWHKPRIEAFLEARNF